MLASSDLSVVVKQLHTNMRVHLCGDVAAGQFAEQLLAIGDGKFPIETPPDVVQLPTWIAWSNWFPGCIQTYFLTLQT